MDTQRTTWSWARGLLGEVLEEVVELRREARLPGPAHVVEQLVHEDERRLLREHLPNHVAGRGDALVVVLGDGGERLLAPELPGDFSPRGLPARFSRLTPAVDDVELGPDEDGDVRLGDGAHLGTREDGIDPTPGAGVVSPPCEVVEGREGVRLPAAELRGHVEDGGGLDLDAREPPHDLGGEVEEALGHEGPLEEPLGLHVVGDGPGCRGCGRGGPRIPRRPAGGSRGGLPAGVMT